MKLPKDFKFKLPFHLAILVVFLVFQHFSPDNASLYGFNLFMMHWLWGRHYDHERE